MRIFNTLSGNLEEFKSNTPGKINMYVCGPTVYNYAHIGNMCPVVTFDMIYRYFKYLGYDVKYVSNFTDVDDKIIKSAIINGVTEKEISEKYIEAYMNDVRALNCLELYKRPKVTETMNEIIDYIGKLMDKGYAYQNGDDVYFRVSKINEYGEISKQVVDDLDYGKRIEVDTNKENPYDFVLWKKTKEGITWDSPFGKGRPGWHTECVVMINNIFGENIDIHGGGIDLKFPHHENEMAQNRAMYGCKLANYWMYNGHVMVDGVKMSKSLGNFILVKDMLEKYSANQFRLALFKNSYRMPFDYTDALMIEAGTIDEKVYNSLKQARLDIAINGYKTGIINHDDKINSIMDEDFNTSNLITYLLDLVKEINTKMRNKEDYIDVYDKINLIVYILGLKYEFVDLSSDDLSMYKEWVDARNNKNFGMADKLRDELIKKNII